VLSVTGYKTSVRRCAYRQPNLHGRQQGWFARGLRNRNLAQNL